MKSFMYDALNLDYRVEGGLGVNFHLGIGPPGDLNHDVEGVGLAVGHKRNVMEGGDGAISILDEDLVGVGVLLPPLLSRVLVHRHLTVKGCAQISSKIKQYKTRR